MSDKPIDDRPEAEAPEEHALDVFGRQVYRVLMDHDRWDGPYWPSFDEMDEKDKDVLRRCVMVARGMAT